MIKLNLGCGKNYMEDYINVDWHYRDDTNKVNKQVDLTKEVPWEDDSVDEIYMGDFLEHIPREKYFWFIDELFRVCKKGAKIKIYVPHYTGISAIQHPCHYNYYGVRHFAIMDHRESFNDDRYTKARFKINNVKLFLAKHNPHMMRIFKIVNIFNWFFNFGGERWQMLMEKLNVFGFEEIYYELEVVK